MWRSLANFSCHSVTETGSNHDCVPFLNQVTSWLWQWKRKQKVRMEENNLESTAKAEEILENSAFLQKLRRNVVSAQKEFSINLHQFLSSIKLGSDKSSEAEAHYQTLEVWGQWLDQSWASLISRDEYYGMEGRTGWKIVIFPPYWDTSISCRSCAHIRAISGSWDVLWP